MADNRIIDIRDMCDGMYEPELSLSLTEDECARLVDALRSAEHRSTSAGGYYLYRLILHDCNGDVEDVLSVDTFNTVESDKNGSYKKTGELVVCLNDLESKYDLNANLWSRKPGHNYLGLLSHASRGYCQEITENNFIRGAEYAISGDDINDLVKEADNVSFSDEPVFGEDKKYTIDLYTENGAGLYSFYVNKDRELFTDEGYRIIDGAFSNNMLKIIKKAK